MRWKEKGREGKRDRKTEGGRKREREGAKKGGRGIKKEREKEGRESVSGLRGFLFLNLSLALSEG